MSMQPSNREALSKKLHSKMNAHRMKRASTEVQQKMLEKAAIPENMRDQYLKAMKHKGGPEILSMIQELSAALPKSMAPPSGVAELVQDNPSIMTEDSSTIPPV